MPGPGSPGELPGADHGSMTAPLEDHRPAPHTDNGIMTRVPGEYIAQASKSLPDPACATDDEMCVEIDAGWVGRVRLTFRKQRYSRPRAKTSYVAWFCRHAEPVAPTATVTAANQLPRQVSGVGAAPGQAMPRCDLPRPF